ncbi:phosphomevalonate kinase [Clostridium swellfunianum]|nr:phosphomevalonate kinase [Clostridium swellfunianum]
MRGYKTMMYSEYKIKVPGKLMVAGEYAVLEPNQKAVVIAVNRYVTAYIKSCNQNILSLPQLSVENVKWWIVNEEVKFSEPNGRLSFVQNSIAVATQYLQEKSIKLQPSNLEIISELDDPLTGKKYGLGSSAAVVVSVVSAMLSLHDCVSELDRDKIFKLSAIAHVKTQGSGSGADIAAAVYGGWLEYCSFSAKWILNELEKGTKLIEMLERPWPNLSIVTLTPPVSLQLAVGWTRDAEATGHMIQKAYKFREDNLTLYNDFLRASLIAVEQLIQSFKSNESIEAIKALSQNRKVLQKLGEESGILIETEKLKNLCSIAENFGSAKSSGAGGGDCGVAFIKDASKKQELYEAWEDADISPLDLCVSEEGIIVMK